MPAYRATPARPARDRLDWALTDDVDAVIVELGANDALRGIEPHRNARRADRHPGCASETRNLPVLLAGMLAPRNLGPEYAAAFDPIFPDLAKGMAPSTTRSSSMA